MAYLGFHKGGGPNYFRWPLVLTQRGTNHVFLFFPMVKKKFVCHGPMAPLNTPLMVCAIDLQKKWILQFIDVRQLSYRTICCRYRQFAVVTDNLLSLPTICCQSRQFAFGSFSWPYLYCRISLDEVRILNLYPSFFQISKTRGTPHHNCYISGVQFLWNFQNN